jgi:beta-lactamase regulating signal transducer with metallopeptidase domain
VTEFLLAATGAFYGWLLTYLLHSTVLLLAVWGLVRVRWVRHPVTQDVVWKVALLGGLITATATTVRDAPSRREAPRPVAVRPVSARAAAAQRVQPTDLASWLRSSVAPGAAGSIAALKVAKPSESCRFALTSLPHDHTTWPAIVGEACPTPRAFLWQHGVVFLWLSGTLLTVGLLIRRRRALLDALGELRPPGSRSRRSLERVTRSGCRIPARLVTSAVADAPCVVQGTTIVLPDRCEEQLPDEELDAVLAHELAHVQRRDFPWLAVLRAVEAVFWIQPLNRIGVAGALEATELACDDRAVARTGRPLGLARSLARVAEWSVRPKIPRSEAALVHAGGNGLTARIRRILALPRPERRNSPWTCLAAVVFLVAPAFLLPSVPAAPVVRRAVLYQLDAADGSEPTLMLLGGAQEMEAQPAAFENGQSESAIGEKEPELKL